MPITVRTEDKTRKDERGEKMTHLDGAKYTIKSKNFKIKHIYFERGKSYLTIWGFCNILSVREEIRTSASSPVSEEIFLTVHGLQ